jgi:hypothetical protein
VLKEERVEVKVYVELLLKTSRDGEAEQRVDAYV